MIKDYVAGISNRISIDATTRLGAGPAWGQSVKISTPKEKDADILAAMQELLPQDEAGNLDGC